VRAVSKDLPPAASCTRLLDKDAAIGAQLKKLPTAFPAPFQDQKN